MVPVSAVRGRGSTAGAAWGSNWWEAPGQTCVAAHRAKGAANYAASLVNLATPGVSNAISGWSGVTFNAALGWVAPGGQDCVFVGGVPGTLYSSLSSTLVVRAVAPATTQIAYRSAVTLIEIVGNGASARFRHNTGLLDVTHDTTIDSVYAVAGTNVYINGVLVGTLSTSAYTAVTNATWRILTNSNTSASAAAVACYSTTLSAADIAELTARMQAL